MHKVYFLVKLVLCVLGFLPTNEQVRVMRKFVIFGVRNLSPKRSGMEIIIVKPEVRSC